MSDQQPPNGGQEPPQKGLRLVWGNYFVSLNRTTRWIIAWIVACAVVNLVVVGTDNLRRIVPNGAGGYHDLSWLAGLLVFLSALATTVLGVRMSPKPLPVDHRHIAAPAAERIDNLNREISQARTLVTAMVQRVDDAALTTDLINAQDRLVSTGKILQLMASDWNEISPGVVDKVIAKRTAGEEMFKKLVADGEQDGQ